VFKEFWAEHRKKLATRTIPENERTYNHFLAFVVEDTDIKTISKAKLRDYIKELKTEKNKRGEVRSDKTINSKYLSQVNKLLQWSEHQGYIDKNPMKGMIPKEKRDKRDDEKRSRFSLQDLRKIFCQSPEYVRVYK
jgi:site-specific recombinase XerD